MNSTKIDFHGLQSSPTIDWERYVTGETAERQRLHVNVITGKGSDPVHPNYGTNLKTYAVSGRMYDWTATQHFCNFAAVDSQFFAATTSYAPIPEIQQVLIQPAADINKHRIEIDIQITFKS